MGLWLSWSMLAKAKHPRGVQGGPVSLLVEDRLEMYLANLRGAARVRRRGDFPLLSSGKYGCLNRWSPRPVGLYAGGEVAYRGVTDRDDAGADHAEQSAGDEASGAEMRPTTIPQ